MRNLHRLARLCLLPWLLQPGSLLAADANASPGYDYFQSNRQMIRNGVQAVLMCNGLFTSQRSLEQVFAQELAYLRPDRFGGIVGSVDGGAYAINTAARSVLVGGGDAGAAIRAVYREGLACVVMAPDQTEADIASLPQLELPGSGVNWDAVAWPAGDAIANDQAATEINSVAMQAASDWVFRSDNPEVDTVSLLVVHRGKIVHERYAPGFDRDTKTRTWSVAKSIAATLIGQLVDAGEMQLDSSLPLEWLPAMPATKSDPRRDITLRQVLQMSSGLEPVDSFNREYATGSGLAYWAGASSHRGMRSRGLMRQPGAFWEYENYDTLLAVGAMKHALGGGDAYLHYPHSTLFRQLGMHNTLVSTDRFGDYIFSSQVYSNARDLARLGLLHLQQGRWRDEQIVSRRWVDFVRSPAPATRNSGRFYGAQWWLVPDDRADVPADAFAAAGNRGQYIVVVPSADLVIVRRGLDWGRQGFDRWDMTREILKAVSPEA